MKISRIFLATVLLCVVAGLARAADQPRVSVAIFDFTTPYKIRLRNDVGVVGSLLTADLSTNPRFTMVERAQLNRALKEQALGLSGEISPQTAARIGKLVGAKVMVTGQIFSADDNVTKYDQPNGEGDILIIANVVGTETGQVFAQKVQGARANLTKLADDLSSKISETITDHYTNLVASDANPTNRLAEIVGSLQGKPHPAVSVHVDEQLLRMAKAGETVQTELGAVLKEAGFEVVDANSQKLPDIEITGTATSSVNGKGNDGLISASATLNIKAQERSSGKILLLDRQDAVGVDLNRQMAAKKALADATDQVAIRLLPVLGK